MSEPPAATEPQARKTPVAIDRVVSLAETRDVRPLDREHVDLLALAVDRLPPIDVVKMSSDRFGILAGYHRLAAHQLAGKKTIRVVVHDLAIEEWHPFAVRSNLTHGLRLTLKQRKDAARQMLEDNPGRSSRAVAKDCGLSDKTVEALRRPETDDDATAEAPQMRIGRDGRTRRVANTREAIRLVVDEPDATDEEIAERTGVKPSQVAEFRAMRSTPLHSLRAFRGETGDDNDSVNPSSNGTRPEVATFDDRCRAWVSRMNRDMLDGAALIAEAEAKNLQLGTHAEIALTIYRRFAERQLDAEIRSFFSVEES